MWCFSMERSSFSGASFASATIQCERVDNTCIDMEKLSPNVEDLKREIQTQTRPFELAIEGKKEKKKLVVV